MTVRTLWSSARLAVLVALIAGALSVPTGTAFGRAGDVVATWGENGTIELFRDSGQPAVQTGDVEVPLDLDVEPSGRILASAATYARTTLPGGGPTVDRDLTLREFTSDGQPTTWRFGRKGTAALFRFVLSASVGYSRDPVRVAADGKIWFEDGENVYRVTSRGIPDATFESALAGGWSVPGRAQGLGFSEDLAVLSNNTALRWGAYGDADNVLERYSETGQRTFWIRDDVRDGGPLRAAWSLVTSDSVPAADQDGLLWLSPRGVWHMRSDESIDRDFGVSGTYEDGTSDFRAAELLANGYAVALSRPTGTAVLALTTNGERNTSFGKGGEGIVARGGFETMRVQPNGSIIVAGTDPLSGPWVARLRPNGRPDRTFGANGVQDYSVAGGLGGTATEAVPNLFAAEFTNGDLLVGIWSVQTGTNGGYRVRMTKIKLGGFR